METKTDLVNNLNNILNPKIEYCPVNKKYILDGIWDTDVNIHNLDEKTYNYEKYLLDNLISFNSPKEIIKEIYEIVWEKVEWYKNHGINEFAFYDVIKKKIQKLSPEFVISKPIEEDIYTKDYIDGLNFEKDDIDFTEILLVIYRYIKVTNNYAKATDLEKVKLIYALQIHLESIENLFHALYKLEMHFEEIDLSAINSSMSYYNIKSNPIKCNVDFNKLETAVLFRFLMDTGLLFMDSKKNKVLLQRFFESNFNFTSEDGYSYPITRLNNDFSKISVDNNLDVQLNTLENLISKLKSYKKKIEIKYVKKKSP
jgi:hypothetical protein